MSSGVYSSISSLNIWIKSRRFGILMVLGSLTLLVVMLALTNNQASATTWYVDDNGGADYIDIQDAIDNATDGDTIYVNEGEYSSIFIVNKQGIFIIGDGSVVNVTKGDGFGIYLSKSSRIEIMNLNIFGGLRLQETDNVTIENNSFFGGVSDGYYNIYGDGKNHYTTINENAAQVIRLDGDSSELGKNNVITNNTSEHGYKDWVNGTIVLIMYQQQLTIYGKEVVGSFGSSLYGPFNNGGILFDNYQPLLISGDDTSCIYDAWNFMIKSFDLNGNDISNLLDFEIKIANQQILASKGYGGTRQAGPGWIPVAGTSYCPPSTPEVIEVTISVKIENDWEETRTLTRDTPREILFFNETNEPPIAIAGDDTSVKPGDAVQFSGSGTDDGTIVKYEWDFQGDGVFDWSSDENGVTTFIYNNEGKYSPVLRITDDDGTTSQDERQITVTNKNSSDDDDGFLPASGLAVVILTVLVAIWYSKR